MYNMYGTCMRYYTYNNVYDGIWQERNTLVYILTIRNCDSYDPIMIRGQLLSYYLCFDVGDEHLFTNFMSRFCVCNSSEDDFFSIFLPFTHISPCPTPQPNIKQ